MASVWQPVRIHMDIDILATAQAQGAEPLPTQAIRTRVMPRHFVWRRARPGAKRRVEWGHDEVHEVESFKREMRRMRRHPPWAQGHDGDSSDDESEDEDDQRKGVAVAPENAAEHAAYVHASAKADAVVAPETTAAVSDARGDAKLHVDSDEGADATDAEARVQQTSEGHGTRDAASVDAPPTVTVEDPMPEQSHAGGLQIPLPSGPKPLRVARRLSTRRV